MTPLMTTVHYVFQSDGSLLWIIILVAVAVIAFKAAIYIGCAIVMIVKFMAVELYDGIKFTIEYWRDKDGRKNGMYKL